MWSHLKYNVSYCAVLVIARQTPMASRMAVSHQYDTHCFLLLDEDVSRAFSDIFGQAQQCSKHDSATSCGVYYM